MDKKPYEVPKLYVLGTVEDLTKQVVKTSGSGDALCPGLTPGIADVCGVIDQVQ